MRVQRALSPQVIGLIIVVIIIVAAAAYFATRPTGPETIKIGFFAPLTGPASADGIAARTGAEIAVEILNENGGINGKKVELVVYDDQLNPDQAIAVSQRMIQQDKVIAGVSGSYSGTTLAASNVWNDAGVPLVVAYAVHPDITKDKPYVFRVGMLAVTEGRIAAKFVMEELGAKNVAILNIDNPFGNSLVDSFKKTAGDRVSVVFEAKFPFPTDDFTPFLNQIKSLEDQGKLDAILFVGYYPHAVGVKQARELGIKAPIVGVEGFDSPKFIEIAGPASEGVYIVTDFDRDKQTDMVKEFIKRYEEKRNIAPDMVAASSFDAVMVLAKAIEKAGKYDGKSIADAIQSTKDYDGVAGKIFFFTEDGNAVKEITVQVIKNGKFTRYKTYDDPELLKP